MRRISQKLKTPVVSVVTILLSMAILGSILHTSWTFWSNVTELPTPDDGDMLVVIGAWGQDDPIDDFTTAFDIIRDNDHFIQAGLRQIHILQSEHLYAIPQPPPADRDIVANQDILLFSLGTQDAHTFIAVQVIKPLPVNIFLSWDNLRAALDTAFNAANPVVSSNWHNNVANPHVPMAFRHGNVYTRSSAPIRHNSANWLARHDNVTSAPAIGNDWFLISDTWVNQAYPAGSFVTHGVCGTPENRPLRWRSMANTTEEPVLGSLVWELLPRLGPELPMFNPPVWVQDGGVSWPADSVVEYNGNFYRLTAGAALSAVAANSPAVNARWERFTLFDPTDTIREWSAGTHAAGTLMWRNIDGVRHFFRASASTSQIPGTPDHNCPWDRITSWQARTGVEMWLLNEFYFNANLGILVEDPTSGAVFQNINDHNNGNNIQGIPPVDGAEWRRIWSWRDIEELPSRLPPVNHPVGGLPAFLAPGLVLTGTQGNWIVWERVGGGTDPGMPSEENANWRRREFPVAATHVYTAHEGVVTLWERTTLLPTTQAPGAGDDWVQIGFRGTHSSVYTVNAAGIRHFWHSTAHSSTFPSIGNPAWQILFPINLAEVLRYRYFYTQNNDTVVFFRVLTADEDVAVQYTQVLTINEVHNMWTGRGDAMRNHWLMGNSYRVGDIVAYGVTATGKTRYFRVRADLDPSLIGLSNIVAGAGNHPPHDYAGRVFWEPVF